MRNGLKRTIKILNLYAGIGGNRKLWPNDEIEVTAVELDPYIAKIYQDFFPNDQVIVGDAHQYLLDHHKEFDFIWSSTPCPTWSRIRNEAGVGCGQNKAVYPDMKLYQEIIFLKHFFKGKWVVENVISYCKPLIKPFIIHEHYFWANFIISGKRNADRCHMKGMVDLRKSRGFDISEYKKTVDERKVLRNCVNPNLGLHVFKCAFKESQETLK